MTLRLNSAAANSWVHVGMLSLLAGIAAGLPYPRLAQLVAVLVGVALFIDGRCAPTSLAHSFLSGSLVLSTCALTWVLVV